MLSASAVLISSNPGPALLVGLVFGIVAVYTLYTKVIPLVLIKNARKRSASEAKNGIVRLEGIATAPHPMKSPIAGVESVYFKTTIEQHHEWVHYPRRLLNLEKTAEFVLRDGSGEIVVDGTRPRFATTRNIVGYEFGNGERPPAGISAEARKMFRENRFPAPNDKRFPEGRIAASGGWFRLREEHMPSGENVTLIAEVSKGRAKPLILTDGEYYIVEYLLMGELVGYSFVAFFAFALVFAFTLMLYYG